MSAQPNFYLWGHWRSKVISTPTLTKRLPGLVRKVVLGDTCIIALSEAGRVYTWGRDSKTGCLGHGTTTSTETPKQVEGLKDVADIQTGTNHVVALTKQGQVWCWGSGDKGQLGNHRSGIHGEVFSSTPEIVQDDLANEVVVQIVVIRKSTFALTSKGTVFAWGDNSDNILGLKDHSTKSVDRPTRLETMDSMVTKLDVFETRTIIAYVAPEAGDEKTQKLLVPDKKDVAMFQGIEEMSKTMKELQEWWTDLVKVRHGQPYELPHNHAPNGPNPSSMFMTSTSVASALTGVGTIHDDLEVDLKALEDADVQLAQMIDRAAQRLHDNRNKSARKNVKLMLCMFIDECRLRQEKVLRTMSARRLSDVKRASSKINVVSFTDFGAAASQEVRKIIAINQEIQRMLEDLKHIDPVDVLTQELKSTLWECLECKMQLHEARILMLQNADNDQPVETMLPALRIIKDRWEALKSFSLYALYKQFTKESRSSGNETDDFKYLVRASNAKIDQLLHIDKDKLVSHDMLVPPLCYELLRENAELRKMTNSYQLQVLLIHEHKRKLVVERAPFEEDRKVNA